jgi:hypothetical protein
MAGAALAWRQSSLPSLRIGHDTGHLLDIHVHGRFLRGPHLLGARLLGAHLLGAHLRDLDYCQRDDRLGDYQRDALHRALHNDAWDDGSGDVHDQCGPSCDDQPPACVTGAGESIVGNHGALRELWPIIVDAP